MDEEANRIFAALIGPGLGVCCQFIRPLELRDAMQIAVYVVPGVVWPYATAGRDNAATNAVAR
jgi:hypothetical protein